MVCRIELNTADSVLSHNNAARCTVKYNRRQNSSDNQNTTRVQRQEFENKESLFRHVTLMHDVRTLA